MSSPEAGFVSPLPLLGLSDVAVATAGYGSALPLLGLSAEVVTPTADVGFHSPLWILGLAGVGVPVPPEPPVTIINVGGYTPAAARRPLVLDMSLIDEAVRRRRRRIEEEELVLSE